MKHSEMSAKQPTAQQIYGEDTRASLTYSTVSKIIDMDGDEVEAIGEADDTETEAEIPEHAMRVIELIRQGMSLSKARENAHIAWDTWHDLLASMPALDRLYAQACQERASKLAEEAQVIADSCDGTSNSQVQKAKLQADTRRWFASKLDPKRYGDYQRTEMTVTEAGNVAGEAQRMLQMRKKKQTKKA